MKKCREALISDSRCQPPPVRYIGQPPQRGGLWCDLKASLTDNVLSKGGGTASGRRSPGIGESIYRKAGAGLPQSLRDSPLKEAAFGARRSPPSRGWWHCKWRKESGDRRAEISVSRCPPLAQYSSPAGFSSVILPILPPRNSSSRIAAARSVSSSPPESRNPRFFATASSNSCGFLSVSAAASSL